MPCFLFSFSLMGLKVREARLFSLSLKYLYAGVNWLQAYVLGLTLLFRGLKGLVEVLGKNKCKAAVFSC